MIIRRSNRILRITTLTVLVACSTFMRTAAQVRPGPPHEQRPVIQPVYDGWYKNADGTLSFSYGYINRSDTPVEVPIGPNNSFSPGQPDRGQPTVFQPGTEHNAIVVVVPADFDQNLMWTVTARGMRATTTERGGLNPLYIISDLPPKVTPENAPARPELGPARRIKLTESTKLSAAVRTNTSPGTKVTYAWVKRSGPGEVKFLPADSQATAATFSERGDYIVRLTVSRPSGMDTIQSSADFKVSVE